MSTIPAPERRPGSGDPAGIAGARRDALQALGFLLVLLSILLGLAITLGASIPIGP